MKIADFKLENHFAKYEFTAPYLLTQSDCESMTTRELLAMEPGAEEGYLEQWLGYTETPGDPELRSLIADLYETLSAEDVFVYHGAQEALFAYMNVLLDKGDHIVVLYPNYQSAYELANSIEGVSFDKWRIRETDGRWAVDFDELEALIKPETKLVAVCSPDNPTGFTFTNKEQEELVTICQKHDLYLFSDEVYKGLETDGEERKWAADVYEKAVSLGVMSKAYGLAGLRVGWLAGKDRALLAQVLKYKNYLSICDSAPSEYLAKVALRHGKELLARNKQIILENKKSADAFFARHTDAFLPMPFSCGPVAYHKLLLPMDVNDFCTRAVEEQGVLLLSSGIFDDEGPYFRMGYGRRGMEEGLNQLELFMKKLLL